MSLRSGRGCRLISWRGNRTRIKADKKGFTAKAQRAQRKTTDLSHKGTEAQRENMNNIIPTNWCDPLLTGKDAVIGDSPYDCNDIVTLLLAIKGRFQTAKDFLRDLTKCELHSIDFEHNQITIDVPEEVLKDGLHAGSLMIDFRPLKE